MIRFSCPVCRQHFSAADDGAGRKLACASCGQRIRIPDASAAPDAGPDAPGPVGLTNGEGRPLKPTKPAYRHPPDRAPLYVAAVLVTIVVLKVLTIIAVVLILCIRLSLFMR